MRTPYVTNPVIALAIGSGPFRKVIFRGYNFVAKRLNRRFTAKTYFDATMLCDPNDYVQRMIHSFGFWEPHISAYVHQTLKPGDVFIDVGANVGYYSLLAAKVVGESGAVIAIEAAPSVFRLLQDNLALNRSENVQTMNIAASDRHGNVELFSQSSKRLGEITMVASRNFDSIGTIACAPLTDIIPGSLFGRVRLIKMDIEGGEIAVMNDLLAHIASFDPRVQVIAEVSVHELRAEWEDIIRRMRENGFSTYSLTNDYDDDDYLYWQTANAPQPLDELPSKQFDILFRRDAME
jgi:FkbM family methyltransferase